MKIKKAILVKTCSFLVILPVFIASCNNKQELDYETLHFTTHAGIKTTLDFDIEMYRADDNPNLFYMNNRYYTKNKDGQWAFSFKPEGEWKVFPDQQGMVPKGLLSLDKK